MQPPFAPLSGGSGWLRPCPAACAARHPHSPDLAVVSRVRCMPAGPQPQGLRRSRRRSLDRGAGDVAHPWDNEAGATGRGSSSALRRVRLAGD